MRKHSAKHAEKKLSLTKRALALCLAMIFVCSCLLPAFANGTDELPAPDAAVEADGGDPEDPVELYEDPVTEEEPIVEEEPISDEDLNEDEPMDEDSGLSTMDETPDEPIADEGGGISLPIAGGDSGISLPVAGGGIVTGGDESESSDDTPKGPTITTDADGNIVYIYDTDDTTIDENPVISRPDGDHALDQVDAGFSIPTNIYHFWLKEMNSYDLAEVRTDAAAADMTVEQYLALHGKDKGCYHIMTAADGANLEDYRFTNPSSTDDPEGDSRTFAGWYTVDEFGEKHDFSFDETVYATEGKTIEVFAKWKESVRTVTADAEISAMDVTVQVDGLAGAKKLKVSALDRYDEDALMETLNEKYADSTIVAHTFELAPLDKNNDELEPESGKKATVTIKGLGLESMENVKVYHKTNLELEDLTSTASVDADGNITFQTESFSPFAVVTVKKQEDYERWYQNLLNCSDDEFKALWQKYEQDEGFMDYLDDLTEEQYTELALRVTENQDDNIATLDITSGTTTNHISLGMTLSLTSTNVGNSSKWESSEPSVVAVDSYDGNKAVVRGVGEGTATITYTFWQQRRENCYQYSESYSVEVDDGIDESAAIYFLATPDGVPSSNETKYWAPTSDTSELLGVINIQNAVWNDNKNIINDVGNHITTWPDGKTSGGSWILKSTDTDTLSNGKSAFNYVLDSIWDAYRDNFTKKLGISDLKKSDIDQITLTAFKISRDNSTTINQHYHIDCTIDVKSKKSFTAKFWVQEPGAMEYTLVDAKEYKNDATVDNTTKRMIGSKVVVDGVTYQLTEGWFRENINCLDNSSLEAASDELVTNWPDKPRQEEIDNDGTVNYYARYVPVTQAMTITKKVTGLMGDKDKEFRFSVSFVPELSEGNIVAEKKFRDGGTAPVELTDFTLRHNDSIVLTGVPIGTKVIIHELNTGDEYTMTVSDATSTGENQYEYTVQATENNVIVTNDCVEQPDAGVLLDTLPYLVILGIAAAGAIVLVARKRKHDDE